MKKLFAFILPALFFAGFILSCSNDNGMDIEPEPEPEECDTEDVTYTSHIRLIVNTNCAISGCHVTGGQGNGSFETYEGIKAKVDNGALRQRVLVEKSMPPTGSLSDCELDQIEAWIDAGGPES